MGYDPGAIADRVAESVGSKCPCGTCCREAAGDRAIFLPMVVCRTCGNKRCPHAAHHDRACTGSNDTGQEGSAYP